MASTVAPSTPAAANGSNKKLENSQKQPNISFVERKDASGTPIPGQYDGVAVRVRLFDDRERVLFFKASLHSIKLMGQDNMNPTASQVCIMCAQKLDLKPDSNVMFSLWIVGHELGAPIDVIFISMQNCKYGQRWS